MRPAQRRGGADLTYNEGGGLPATLLMFVLAWPQFIIAVINPTVAHWVRQLPFWPARLTIYLSFAGALACLLTPRANPRDANINGDGAGRAALRLDGRGAVQAGEWP